MHKLLISTFVILTFCVSVFGQPPGGGCIPDEDPDCSEEQIPLDKHVIYLIGGSVLMGIIYQRKGIKETIKA